ncbi:hypothetical protein ACWGH4_05750 [Streptomyces sp. NPDC054847]
MGNDIKSLSAVVESSVCPRLQGHFEPLDTFVGGWLIEFNRMRPREGLLRHLESLAWPNPASVQVLIHDEDDDCFGMWMMRAGVLTDVQLPGHRRLHPPAPATEEFPPDPGVLWRTETAEPVGYSTERRTI